MSTFVYLVEDDAPVRDALKALVESAGLHARTFPSAEAFLTACDPTMSGCLVLDISLPGMSGLDLQQALLARGIVLPIIFLTGYGTIPMTVAALKLGALDFLEKPVDGAMLLQRIEWALQEVARQLDATSVAPIARARIASLTTREHQVMKLTAEGLTNKEIARRLAISHRTVEIHRSRVMKKMQVHSAVELASLVRKAGLDLRGPSTPRVGD